MQNRLQLQLDEEEFGLDAPAAPAAPAPAPVATPKEKPVDTKPPEIKPSEPEPKTVEPAPAPAVETTDKTDKPAIKETVPVDPKPVAPVAMTSEMTFEEKKKLRAKRFGLPVVVTKEEEAQKKQERAKRFGLPAESGSKKRHKMGKKNSGAPSQKNTVPAKAEEPLLPKEEIERRLKRAEKYGIQDTENVMKLKAMLRKYRFS